MEIDGADDLTLRTYYMVDWKSACQTDSNATCVTCGGKMRKFEPYRDKKGIIYDGLVCHTCKQVYWLKRD